MSNPPIREALVDIYVTGAENVRPEALLTLAGELKARYPTAEERKSIEASFQLGKVGALAATTKDVGFVGYFLKSSDGRRVVQYRRNGFTLNQVAGYTTADDLFAEALDLWPRYVRTAAPGSISRLALRYINDFALPFRQRDPLSRFLLAAPSVPDAAPQLIDQFQMNLMLTDAPTETQVKVVQSLKGGNPDARYILDIEASCRGPLELSANLPELLGRLRAVKNRVFFSFLADEAIAPFD